MSGGTLHVRGELYLSLETVAELYHVQAVWVREVYDSGLLGSGVASGSVVCIGAVQLDRFAMIVRLNTVLGLDMETIAVSLDEFP